MKQHTLAYGLLALTLAIVIPMSLVGCNPNKVAPPPVYEGNVDFHKVNGDVVSVTVTFPSTGSNNGQPYITVTTREEVEALELQMQSMLKDLQYVKEQMPYHEQFGPPVESTDEVRPLPE